MYSVLQVKIKTCLTLHTRSRNEKHVKTTKIYIFVRMKFMIPKIAQRSFSRFPSGKIEIELIL
jgi:hypothetical protein